MLPAGSSPKLLNQNPLAVSPKPHALPAPTPGVLQAPMFSPALAAATTPPAPAEATPWSPAVPWPARSTDLTPSSSCLTPPSPPVLTCTRPLEEIPLSGGEEARDQGCRAGAQAGALRPPSLAASEARAYRLVRTHQRLDHSSDGARATRSPLHPGISVTGQARSRHLG